MKTLPLKIAKMRMLTRDCFQQYTQHTFGNCLHKLSSVSYPATKVMLKV